MNVNSTITIGTPQANDISKVTLVRNASVTHRYNFDQRYLELAFTKGANQLTVTTPANNNLVPPGYYMLFILNAQGVPSVAKTIKVENSGVASLSMEQMSASSLQVEDSSTETDRDRTKDPRDPREIGRPLTDQEGLEYDIFDPNE